MKLQNKKVKLSKIEAVRFSDKHPNGINVGYIKEGIALNDLEINNSFYLSGDNGMFSSSSIVEIDEVNSTFKTNNSIYKIEIID